VVNVVAELEKINKENVIRKKVRIKQKNQKLTSRKKKRTLNDKNRRLKAEFKAR